MTPQREESLRLLDLAWRDLRAMKVLAEAQGIEMSLVGFHGQQAVEKAFKAVLTDRGQIFRRTHDLVELAALLTDVGVRFRMAPDVLQALGRFAVEYRYDDPQEYPLPSLRCVEWSKMCSARLRSC